MSDTANAFGVQLGTDPLFLTVGPLASGLILASVRLLINFNNDATLALGAVMAKNVTAAADNFAAGNSIVERTPAAAGGQPLLTFALGASILHELVLAPQIRLPTRPIYMTFRLAHDQALSTGRYFIEVMTLDRDEVRTIEQLGRIIQTIPGSVALTPPPAAAPI